MHPIRYYHLVLEFRTAQLNLTAQGALLASLTPRRHGGVRAGAQQSLSSHESLRVSSLLTETSTLHLWLPVHAPTAKVAASSRTWKVISSASIIVF